MNSHDREIMMRGITAGLILGAASCYRNGADRQAEIILGESGVKPDDKHAIYADNNDLVTLMENHPDWSSLMIYTGNTYIDTFLSLVYRVHCLAGIRLAAGARALRDRNKAFFDGQHTFSLCGLELGRWNNACFEAADYWFWKDIGEQVKGLTTFNDFQEAMTNRSQNNG